MKAAKEEVEGSTVYANLFTDDEGNAWNIIRRAGGSISLYATRAGDSVHYVIFDSLDGEPPSEAAQGIISRLREMAEGIALLNASIAREGDEEGIQRLYSGLLDFSDCGSYRIEVPVKKDDDLKGTLIIEAKPEGESIRLSIGGIAERADAAAF